MDAVVVLELDLQQLDRLARLGHRAAAQQRAVQDGTATGAEAVRLPNTAPPEHGPGSGEMPLKASGAGPVGIAVVAILAEKLVESVLDFGKKEVQGSRVLNSYFAAMGKTLSAAVDIVLIPFTPVLNLLLAGMVKFMAWLTGNGHLAAISDGLEKLGNGFVAMLDWARRAYGFFNDSWNPSHWDWKTLGSGITATLAWFMGKMADLIGAMQKYLGSSVGSWVKRHAGHVTGHGFWGKVGGLLQAGVAGTMLTTAEASSYFMDLTPNQKKAAQKQLGENMTRQVISAGVQTVKEHPLTVVQTIITSDPIAAGKTAVDYFKNLSSDPKPTGGVVPVHQGG